MHSTVVSITYYRPSCLHEGPIRSKIDGNPYFCYLLFAFIKTESKLAYTSLVWIGSILVFRVVSNPNHPSDGSICLNWYKLAQYWFLGLFLTSITLLMNQLAIHYALKRHQNRMKELPKNTTKTNFVEGFGPKLPSKLHRFDWLKNFKNMIVTCSSSVDSVIRPSFPRSRTAISVIPRSYLTEPLTWLPNISRIF